MNKVLIGLLLGAALGAVDGSLAIVYHPEDPNVRADMTVIVMMGTFKASSRG